MLTRRAFLRALGLGVGALGLLLHKPKPGAGAPFIAGPGRARAEGVTPGPAAFDSGVRAVREVAEALTGRGRGVLEAYPPGSVLFLGLLSLLPEPWRVAGLDWGIAVGAGAPPASASSVDAEALFSWCVRQYPTGPYSAVVIGAPSGAAAHLAALLRAPLLTSSLLLAFRRPSTPPDDVAEAQKRAEPLLEALTQARERISALPFELVHHVDPVHDRLLVKHLALVRVKLHALPEAYRAFLRERLEPGGALVLLNCTYPWPQYRLGDGVYVPSRRPRRGFPR